MGPSGGFGDLDYPQAPVGPGRPGEAAAALRFRGEGGGAAGGDVDLLGEFPHRRRVAMLGGELPHGVDQLGHAGRQGPGSIDSDHGMGLLEVVAI
jgi:hypothetical protein